MRVLQLIDSLNPGGAERMAVNLANLLVGRIDGSYLCTTRREGGLKEMLNPEVGYLFLHKRKSLDLSALMRLKRFVAENRIDVVHAHTTSFFIATQLRLIKPGLKLIWHEHHGARTRRNKKQSRILLRLAKRFSHIITVNPDLKSWWAQRVGVDKVSYIQNFVQNTELKVPYEQRKKQIICLANLRDPKDHLNLLRAFQKLSEDFQDWELVLIGKDLDDEYSRNVKTFIEKNSLRDSVKILGEVNNIEDRLQQAAIGVLSSSSEGLPMALLEYGMAGLAVVSTDVGNCAEVIANFGTVVPPSHPGSLASALERYIEDSNARDNDSKAFRRHIVSRYSEEAAAELFIEIYSK